MQPRAKKRKAQDPTKITVDQYNMCLILTKNRNKKIKKEREDIAIEANTAIEANKAKKAKKAIEAIEAIAIANLTEKPVTKAPLPNSSENQAKHLYDYRLQEWRESAPVIISAKGDDLEKFRRKISAGECGHTKDKDGQGVSIKEYSGDTILGIPHTYESESDSDSDSDSESESE